MGFYPYTVYIVGYKINPENLVKWFSKYDLDKYDISFTDTFNILEQILTKEIQNVIESVSKDFKDITLYCDSDQEAYIKFTVIEDSTKKIADEYDDKAVKRRVKKSAERELRETETILNFIRDKYEKELYKEITNYHTIRREALKMLKEIPKEHDDNVMEPGFMASVGKFKDLEKKKKKKILELVQDIPKETLNRAKKMYLEIEGPDSEISDPEVFILERCWSTY